LFWCYTEQSDWERQHEQQGLPRAEEAVALPAYPAERDLIRFSFAAPSDFRFFVDGASISVGDDGVVRYTLVARSAAGVDNVSFEGMRCATEEVRLYAIGRERSWVERPGDWRPIRGTAVQRWHETLYGEYFCRLKQPIASAREGVRRLRGDPRD
jgi:hypothetical protein